MTDVQSNGFHPAVREAAADISLVYHERDELRIKNRNLENDLAISNGMNKHFQEELDRITKQRDYYYRKAFAYTNTLSSCRNQIEGLMDIVDHEAENPGPNNIPAETLKQLEDKITDGGWNKPNE